MLDIQIVQSSSTYNAWFIRTLLGVSVVARFAACLPLIQSLHYVEL